MRLFRGFHSQWISKLLRGNHQAVQYRGLQQGHIQGRRQWTLRPAHTKSNKSSKSKKVAEKTKDGKSVEKSGKSAKKSGSKSGKDKKSTKSGKSAKKSGSSKSKSKKSAEKSKKGGSQKEKSLKTQVDTSASVKKEQSAGAPPVVTAKPVQVRQLKPIEVRAEPKEMSFKATGGFQAVNIVNNSGEKRVFKVKCSDNQLYRVHPVYSVIEAGQTGRIEVLRNNGTNKMDKLILLSAKVDGDVADLKNFFAKIDNQEQHLMAVPLIVDA